MTINKNIDSFKSNFNSAEGAYAYLLINSLRPEYLAFSTNDEVKKTKNYLVENLKKANSLEDVEKIIDGLSEKSISLIPCYDENVNAQKKKKALIKAIKNIKYLDLNWSSKEEAWLNLKGFISINGDTPFPSPVEENIINTSINNFKEVFGLKEVNINSQKSPLSNIMNFEKSCYSLAKLLKIPTKKIGMNILMLSIQSENIEFSGYASHNEEALYLIDKIVVNEISSFAHEWLHFFDNVMGQVEESLSVFFDFSDEDKKKMLNDTKQFLDFKSIANKKTEIKELDFVQSMEGSLYFLNRFAKNKDSYKDELKVLSEKILKKIEEKEIKEVIHEEFSKGIDVIAPNMPEYFKSFGKTVCDMKINILEKKELENNQFIEFSKINDKYLNMNDYSSSNEELIARSFEKFVFDYSHNKFGIDKKLTEEEKKSLLFIVDKKYNSDFFPQGDVAKNLNDYWIKTLNEISDLLSDKNKKYGIKNIEKFLSSKSIDKKNIKSMFHN